MASKRRGNPQPKVHYHLVNWQAHPKRHQKSHLERCRHSKWTKQIEVGTTLQPSATMDGLDDAPLHPHRVDRGNGAGNDNVQTRYQELNSTANTDKTNKGTRLHLTSSEFQLSLVEGACLATPQSPPNPTALWQPANVRVDPQPR